VETLDSRPGLVFAGMSCGNVRLAVIPAKHSASRNSEGITGNGLHSVKNGLDSRFSGMTHTRILS